MMSFVYKQMDFSKPLAIFLQFISNKNQHNNFV